MDGRWLIVLAAPALIILPIEPGVHAEDASID